MLNDARPKDTLTLWHLLTRVDGDDRVRVYEKMAALDPPPPGVTREGILQLDQKMLELWRDELKSTWMGVGKGVPKPIAEAYWRAKTRVEPQVERDGAEIEPPRHKKELATKRHKKHKMKKGSVKRVIRWVLLGRRLFVCARAVCETSEDESGD